MSTPNEKKQKSPARSGFVLIPRVVRLSYRDLSHGEKWCYVCLKDLCGEEGGTCYRTLRTLAQETGIACSSLGGTEGMIRRLHDAGLIRAEKLKRSGSSKEIWYITIVDIWEQNATFLANLHSTENGSTVPPSQIEQSPNDDAEREPAIAAVCSITEGGVQKSNEQPPPCSEERVVCSESSDRIRIYNKTSVSNENPENEREILLSPSVSSGGESTQLHAASFMLNFSSLLAFVAALTDEQKRQLVQLFLKLSSAQSDRTTEQVDHASEMVSSERDDEKDEKDEVANLNTILIANVLSTDG